MQILHKDQNNRKAIISVFFDFPETPETEDDMSDFLLKLGYNPAAPSTLESIFQASLLSTTQAPTIVDLRSVNDLTLTNTINSFSLRTSLQLKICHPAIYFTKMAR